MSQFVVNIESRKEILALFLRKSGGAIRLQIYARRGNDEFSARTGGDTGRQARSPFLSLPAIEE